MLLAVIKRRLFAGAFFVSASIAGGALSAPITVDFSERYSFSGSNFAPLHIKGVTISGNIPTSSYVSGSWDSPNGYLDGSALQTTDHHTGNLLTLQFPKPTPVIEFGSSFDFFSDRLVTDPLVEVFVELFDSSSTSLGSTLVNSYFYPSGSEVFTDRLFTYSGVPISKAVFRMEGNESRHERLAFLLAACRTCV